MKNCKFLAGHLVMSMRQGWGGDLCNRGDPPSNMTAHRYQPSPNIKWTRLPFSHEHKSFPKPPLLCVCVPERSSWFSRGRGEAICEGKGSSTLHRHRARSSSRDRWPPPLPPSLHSRARPSLKKPQSGSTVVESKCFSHKQFLSKPVFSLFMP